MATASNSKGRLRIPTIIGLLNMLNAPLPSVQFLHAGPSAYIEIPMLTVGWPLKLDSSILGMNCTQTFQR